VKQWKETGTIPREFDKWKIEVEGPREKWEELPDNQWPDKSANNDYVTTNEHDPKSISPSDGQASNGQPAKKRSFWEASQSEAEDSSPHKEEHRDEEIGLHEGHIMDEIAKHTKQSDALRLEQYIIDPRNYSSKDLATWQFVLLPHPVTILHNKELIELLSNIRDARKYNGSSERFDTSLVYEFAIASLKIMPPITYDHLSFFGTKISSLIKEFLDTGEIRSAQATEQLKTLLLFNKIWGVGAHTAQQWYYKGIRTLEQVSRLDLSPNQRAGVELFDDLNKRLSRTEVEEVYDYFKENLAAVDPTAISSCAGGYCRGKESSGDVDILITVEHGESGLLQKLVERFQENGFIKHIFSKTMYGENARMKENHRHSYDLLDKVLAICLLPGKTVHHQIDLIVSPWISWPTALAGWRGNTLFERALRRAAAAKGYKFASHGLFKIQGGKRVPVSSEEHLFETIGIPYVPPTLRNP